MPAAERLHLRAAGPGDLEIVFEWVNDPVTRAMSLSTALVPYADHCAWFEAALSNPERHLFIASIADEPFAFLRLDDKPDASGCTISINLAPSARGRGLGRASLEAMTIQADRLGFAHIDAWIRADNTASLLSFSRAGYREVRCEAELLLYRKLLEGAR